MIKVKIETHPVAWSDGATLKYQTSAAYGDRRIYGDPKPTEEGAYKSMLDEVCKWFKAVKAIKTELTKED